MLIFAFDVLSVLMKIVCRITLSIGLMSFDDLGGYILATPMNF